MKNHPFFFGVDWNTIRQIDAPFVPNLRSITDTSYFPTEELDQVPEDLATGDSTGANKDLAFLGYGFCCLLRKQPKQVFQLYLQAVPDLLCCFLIFFGFYLHCSWSVSGLSFVYQYL
jgi:hypothetical protein